MSSEVHDVLAGCELGDGEADSDEWHAEGMQYDELL